jgi:16S rRNA processing protein RimM
MSMDSSQASSLFCAAVLASAHGVRGHMKVKCFLEDPSHFKDYSPFSNEAGETLYKVKNVLSQDKDRLIVALEGVNDRTAASHLRGTQLMLSRTRLPELSEDTFYHRDLKGLAVLSSQGQLLGKVWDLHNFGASDLLEVQVSQGEQHMIPFTKPLVPEVNLKEGHLLLSEEGEQFLKRGDDVP